MQVRNTRYVVLVAALAGAASAQYIELGPPPIAVAQPRPLSAGPPERAPGAWYDTASRSTIRDLYNNTFAPTDNVAMGWTGSVAGCNAGTVSSGWLGAAATRVNWFRGMAGIPTGITLYSTWNAKDQKAALMMSAQNQLNHNPPSSWTCYSADGAEAAGKSNLCWRSGYGNYDPGCVAGYIEDSGASNYFVGHRRWILYPQTTKMGEGAADQSGSYGRAGALWVQDDSSIMNGPRPTTRDGFVAWPPKGYVPYQTVYKRWSFSYAGANFTSANVTMTRNGVNVSVVKQTVYPTPPSYVGEPTLVWEVPDSSLGNPGADATFRVTVSGITGLPQSSYTYDVIVFDPATGGGSTTASVTVGTNPSGRSFTVDGTSYTTTQTFTWDVNSNHTISTTSPQTGSGTRYTFQNWSNGSAQLQQSITVPSGGGTYTANFSTAYLITTSVSPGGAGTVSRSPNPADGYHPAGASVQFTANANAGYQFSSWGGAISSTSNPVNVTINGPGNIVANFTGTVTGTPVTITTSPAGLGITVDGTAYTAPQTFQWTPGSPHTIATSSPQGGGSTRYVYANWSDGGAVSHQIATPGAATTYTANFNTQYLLTVNVTPAGAGTVARNPSSGDGFYSAGTSVQLTPSAAAGYQFSAWSGDGSGSPVRTVTMTAPRTAAAAFTSTGGGGGGCTYTFSKPGGSAAPFGEYGDVWLTTTSACDWTATSDVPWIYISFSSDGPGMGYIMFDVDPNFTSQARTGNVRAGNATFPVFQPASTCGVTLGAQTAVIPAGGGAINTGLSTNAGCQWMAYASDTWITPPSQTGAGSGAFNFSAAANGGAPRTASIQTGGQLLQVLQKGAASQVFDDVPPSHAYFDHIWLLRSNGVTSGCSATSYCPDGTTTRSQMAVFIIRSILGTDSFSYNPLPYFTDVPATHPHFKFVQKMFEFGITTGCSATAYCPDNPVTRGQMAVFLIRARFGISAGDPFPFPPNAVFGDVPSSHPYFSFIQEMRNLGITTGCTSSAYCPDNPTTRGQMAVFLIRGLLTP